MARGTPRIDRNGNDHVHVMVQLATDDGWINTFNDMKGAQKSCREMERERPELVELDRSNTEATSGTGTRNGAAGPNGRRGRTTTGRSPGLRSTGTSASGESPLWPRRRCRNSMSAESWRRARRRHGARTSSSGACAARGSASTASAQGRGEGILRLAGPGGRIPDHLAQQGRLDGTVQRV